MPFKRILTAVDFSPNSLEAFRVAAEMASVHSAALHLLHVIEALPSGPGEATMEFVQKANEAVEQLVASLQPGLDKVILTTEVASGRAFDEIVNRARDWRADLIALGTKGSTSLEEIFLGGTAEHVIKESSCSVLIVRPEDRARI
ncbi:MAG TPA: universal stress protein [Candidatus Polarisedimenticolaceae bacterium]|nr:universal stress protein [Candidatus Polarisedimenticolaceae bacterium]